MYSWLKWPGKWFAAPKAVRNWRVTRRLIILVAIPTVLGLALAGLRITDAVRSAGADRQVGRLAVLGQQVTGLTQALENERAGTATYIADGRRAAGLPALHRQYAITNAWAASIRREIGQLGSGYPAQTQASAASVLASIAEVPGLRRSAEGQAAALTVINGYSAATAGLLTVNDGLADLSGNPGLLTSVRALGALSRMKDHASQQEAILGGALAQGHFGPGDVMALAIAQAQQASDLVAFRSSATPEETWALTRTLAASVPRQTLVLEQRAIVAGPGALALDVHAGQQWQAGMSHTVGWMRHAEQQLTGSITSYAQAQQRGRGTVRDHHGRRGTGRPRPDLPGHPDDRQVYRASAPAARSRRPGCGRDGPARGGRRAGCGRTPEAPSQRDIDGRPVHR